MVSYTRVFHPSTPWLLDPTITCPDTARLAWRREGQAEVLVDLVRNPGPRAALLDASTEASARDGIAGGASAVRAVNLSAPRTSHVLLAGSSSWQPWQAGIGLSLAPTSWEVA
ncbi:hypothetical protein L6241_03055 [Janibacter sp. Y6]|uniref:hypothetical protein n=1 Tax=Janibacter sp. Y6 TaxID=2913552 RepID=UPI0034A25CB1